MDDPYLAAWNRFTDAANAWARYTASLSPASSDYETRVRAKWQRERVSERFREMEDECRLTRSQR